MAHIDQFFGRSGKYGVFPDKSDEAEFKRGNTGVGWSSGEFESDHDLAETEWLTRREKPVIPESGWEEAIEHEDWDFDEDDLDIPLIPVPN